jgi:hypothetical protein
MFKEDKEPDSMNSQQEELIEPEYGFVHDFFISEERSGGIEKMTATEQPQEKKDSESKLDDQSVKFFLPDLFTDEF